MSTLHPFSNSRAVARATAVVAALVWLSLAGAPQARAQQPPEDQGASPVWPTQAPLVEATPVQVPQAAQAPTDAPTAQPAAEPTGAHVLREKKVRLDKGDQNVIRSGPGNTFSIVGIYPEDSEFVVIAKSGDWYNVRLSDVSTGWIHASLCHEFDDMSDLEFRPNPRLFSRIGSFVVTGYGGGYAFDRKSNSIALGGRLGYYVLEFLEVEGGVSWTHVNRPAEIVETLFGLTLEAEEFHMLYYQLNGNLHLLPGRQMVPFLTGGVGSSILRGKTESALNYGAGVSLYVSKTVAVRWEVRNYRFESGNDDSRRTNSNIEFGIGTSLLF